MKSEGLTNGKQEVPGGNPNGHSFHSGPVGGGRSGPVGGWGTGPVGRVVWPSRSGVKPTGWEAGYPGGGCIPKCGQTHT